MENLDELPQGEVLRSISVYQLLQPGTRVDLQGNISSLITHIEIRVFKYLNGERVGTFLAQPFMAFTYGADEFAARGDTEQEALYAMLDKIKGVPFEKIFPKEQFEV
jgi:hypothetical protein